MPRLVLLVGVLTATLLSGRTAAAMCLDPDARAAVRSGCDCAAATDHGSYVRCARLIAQAMVPPGCVGDVVRCAARSTCGKADAVTCCRTNSRGSTKCGIKSGADKCKAPRGG